MSQDDDDRADSKAMKAKIDACLEAYMTAPQGVKPGPCLACGSDERIWRDKGRVCLSCGFVLMADLENAIRARVLREAAATIGQYQAEILKRDECHRPSPEDALGFAARRVLKDAERAERGEP